MRRRSLSGGSMGALAPRPIRGQRSIGPKCQQPFVAKAARYDAGGASAREKLTAAGEKLAEATPGRRTVLQGVAGAAWLLSGEFPATAETAVAGKLKRVADPVLAYEFLYPVETASGKKLNMSFSRRPEKYSSAAPLTSDARQRIVCELVDLVNSVTVSVSVGPAPARLVSQPASSWRAKAVADSVLIDKSTARITTGQRVSLSTVEASGIDVRDGGRYYVYEHVAQGSPTIASNAAETFRHALAVTAVRSGINGTPYLFTLNLACPDNAWLDLAPLFEQAVSSFRLVTPGRDYVPPDKDPWLFF